MDEKQLRALVREEVEAALDDEARVDSHPKFRRLVEAKLGRKFDGSDEHWDLTYNAWHDALSETAFGTPGVPDESTVDYYVNETVEKILGH